MAKSEKDEKPKMGRPTRYNEDVCSEICFRLSNGESTRKITRDDHMPAMATLFKWLNENNNFMERYTQAKKEMVECMASELTEIADDSTNDFYEKKLKNGEVAVAVDNELVNRSKLRVDTRKWVCERLMPNKYGLKQDLKVSGSITVNKVQFND